ncbi:MAG: hypothetical protein WAN23_16790 [Candidatus Acidiferrales bacterium]
MPVDHDVLRFQVAVHHAFAVSYFERQANLFEDPYGLLGTQPTLVIEEGFEVLPLDELHGDELDSACFAEIEDPNHVAMRDLAGENQLLLEALKNFRMNR